MLAEIGATLRKHLRMSDIACRYGGEELAVILPESTATDACMRLDSVRQMLRSTSLGYRGQILPSVTFSVGIAEFPPHGQSAAELIHAADTALYCAKNEGRDRIVLYTPPAPGIS